MLQQHINGATAKPTETSFHDIVSDIGIDTQSGQGVIPSVAIDKILAHRQAGLAEIGSAMSALVKAIAELNAAGCDYHNGMSFSHAVEKSVQYCDRPDIWKKMVTREVDRKIWHKLMSDTGMLTLMNSDQLSEWHTSLYSDNMPEATLDNVLASFKQLHADSALMIEKGILSLFKKLSWDYKTNNPRMFGKKIIMNSLLEVNRWGASVRSDAQARIDDLQKAFCLLDKKPVPDFRDGAGVGFSDYVNKHGLDGERFECEYFSVRYFKKGSGHVTFLRPELVDMMNDVLSRHYPHALPAA
ncbi:DUF4942 domain-containing protein [Pectobacterium brasiliense]|uniref:DUF4942 domain-containing protein n=1 Tax=Pectobacterium brasiliense TaxID=180957 RepID=UPI0019691234|nr:DUF4942 domain-containing protein [Pectobacterium brasiliense]MBN3265776.1 DUF4942 domain-containing protein [Pectobacterium brasiliense]